MRSYGACGAVKQVIVALTRGAAAEWGVDGIRVLAIAPHADSAALNAWIEANPEEAETFRHDIPLGRVGRGRHDIGVAVAALVGSDFNCLTGAIAPLDGGQASFT